MRSSKSRSRSKTNRPRTIGNIVNRVFDSSGPEGKVRGTPQQIIEKYHMLARDAQLSNDRVAAENFQQHAEHYTRMLGEAQRELAAEQEQRREPGQNVGQNVGQNSGQNAGQNAGQNFSQNGGHNGNPSGGYGQNGSYRDRNTRDDAQDQAPAPRIGSAIDLVDDAGDSGLVETPETRARPEPSRPDAPRGEYRERAQSDRRDDRPRFQPQDRRTQPQVRPVEDASPPVAVEPLAPMMPSFAPPEPSAAVKPAAVRRPRAPRKPKTTDGGPAEGDGGGDESGGPAEAAE